MEASAKVEASAKAGHFLMGHASFLILEWLKHTPALPPVDGRKFSEL